MPEERGGGDFDLDANWHGPERKFPEHNCSPGPMPEDYQAIAKRTIGRWAGDRIALIGDYAQDDDLKDTPIPASKIYEACHEETKEVWNRNPDGAAYKCGDPKDKNYGKYCHYKTVKPPLFTDVTDDVARVIEHELRGTYSGDGWRNWKYDNEKETADKEA